MNGKNVSEQIVAAERVATSAWKLAGIIGLIVAGSFSAGAASFKFLTADFVRTTDRIRFYVRDAQDTKFVLDVENLSDGSKSAKDVLANANSQNAFLIEIVR